ncbi:MAG: hypothetical protein WC505_04840 [Patescibacteria group bacterium]
METRTHQHGIALLYSLLVISLFTAIAITISIIVINELKLTASSTDATVAYYAAESGIERGLHTVQLARADSTKTLQDAVDEVGQLSADLDWSKASYTDEDSQKATSRIEHVEVKEYEYIQADYYDVSSPLDPTDGVVVRTLMVVNGDGITNPDAASYAEVSWTAWNSNGLLESSASARKVIGPSDLEEGWTLDLQAPYSDTFIPVGYRVRVKALLGDLSDVTLTPRKADGNELSDDELPSQLQIKSIGTYRNFKQSLTATVPWKVPLFGLYDYVLFSESTILKDIVLSAPTYSSGVIHPEANIPTNQMCNLSPCDGSCESTWDWQGWCPSGSTRMACYGSAQGAYPPFPPGTCAMGAELEMYGFVLPMPDTVPQGDEYYVSLRMHYHYNNALSDGQDRDLSVSISGQSIIVNDQKPGETEVWHTCTIPETFSLGDPALPETDQSRTIEFAVHPYGDETVPGTGWEAEDFITVDWYQLSTYKVFPDCE